MNVEPQMSDSISKGGYGGLMSGRSAEIVVQLSYIQLNRKN